MKVIVIDALTNLVISFIARDLRRAKGRDSAKCAVAYASMRASGAKRAKVHETTTLLLIGSEWVRRLNPVSIQKLIRAAQWGAKLPEELIGQHYKLIVPHGVRKIGVPHRATSRKPTGPQNSRLPDIRVAK